MSPTFNESFPSVNQTAKLLREAKDSCTVQAFSSAANVFIMCARTALDEIHRSFVDSHNNDSYGDSKFAVEFIISQVDGQIRNLDPSKVETVLDLVDITVATLQKLLTVAWHATSKKKPLPAIPCGDPLTASAPQDYLSASDKNKLDAESNRLSFFNYELVDSGVDEEAYNLSPHQFPFDHLRGLFKHGAAPKPLSVKSEYLTSSATLCNDVDSQSASLPGSTALRGRPADKKLPDIPYVPRQSAFFPDVSEDGGEMPLPTGDTNLVRLNYAGEVKAGSFTALVRMLTSKNAILEPDLIPTFFAGFRIFGSVTLFLEELKKRFDEAPPENLDAGQLRIWTREAFRIRLRVGKILFLWLTDYWQPDADKEMIGQLHSFAVDRIQEELPGSLATPILEMIGSRMDGDEEYITSHKNRYLRTVTGQVAQEDVEQTGFLYPDKFASDTFQALALFDSDAGREEFAQQFTVKHSAMFRELNPQDVVTYWHRNSDSKLGPLLLEITNLARSLAMFVTHSILVNQQRHQRAKRIEFWINIATICLQYRNYFGSHVIFAGITHSTVNRLKRTILELSKPSKMEFCKLDQFFSGHSNFAPVRKAMGEKAAATVPLLLPFKQDIIGAKQIPPTVGLDDKSHKEELINLVPYKVLMKTIQALESCLIPYQIPANAKFTAWLSITLQSYPTHEECNLYDMLYRESQRVEPRDGDLEKFSDTWTYLEVTKHGNRLIQQLPL
ncbi:hypothetical protein AX17_006287 [Amanita inopinata Kibby_2008]|nr:hypothetical protein AX17_006287 [Amanita inopinata Kibby_2008]